MKRFVTTVILQLFVLSMMSLSFLFLSVSAQEYDVYVGGTGPGNYTSIQTAISNAVSHSTIYVYPGIYYEHLSINKSIRLFGENQTTTVIDSEQTSSCILLYANNTVIQNFTIRNGSDDFPNAGIMVYSQNNIIAHNHLTDNLYGIILYSPAASNMIIGNVIDHNHRCGIYLSGSTDNCILVNTIDDQPFNGVGLFDFSNSNIIQGNTFSQMHLNGVVVHDSYNNSIIENSFRDNNIGLHLWPPGLYAQVNNNVFVGNTRDLYEEEHAFLPAWMAFAFFAVIGFFILKKLLHVSKKP